MSVLRPREKAIPAQPALVGEDRAALGPTPAQAAQATGPFLILSAATGYGGAERSIEIILRRLPTDLPVWIVAQSEHHLQVLESMRRPLTRIFAVTTSDERSFRKAVHMFKTLYARLRPAVILANTHHSARIVAAASAALPEIDARTFLYLRDFLWDDIERILHALPSATLIAPDRYVIERGGYVAHLLKPEAARRIAIVPDMVEIPDTPPVVDQGNAPFVHLATVNAWKGHDHLIRAMVRLRAGGSSARLISAGYRPDPKRFDALARQINADKLQDAVELRDFEADPSRLIRSCCAVVVASVSHSGGAETFGRTIIEAWSRGRPVIAFAAGAPAQLIRHGIDGLLVPEGDDVALAAAMARLIDDPALCERLGRNGLDRAKREFEAGLVVDRLLAVLADAPPRIGRLEAMASRAGLGALRRPATHSENRSDPNHAHPTHDADDLRLLAACLAAGSSEPRRSETRVALAARGYDRLFTFASDLRVAPVLVDALRDASLAPAVPALTLPDGRRTVTREMEFIASEHAERRKALTQHLTEIVAALNAAGLVPILIKGARSLWLGEPRWRTLRDLDLVLEGSTADAAQSAALGRGYRTSETIAERPGRHHLAPLFRDDLPGWIEIHRRAGNRYAEPLLPTRELVLASHEVARDGLRARILSDAHHVLHALVHHHFGHSGFARGTVDIKGLVEFHLDLRGLDESQLCELQERSSRHPLLLGALDLWIAAAADLFDARIEQPLHVKPDAAARWRAVLARLLSKAAPRWKYPGYAEEMRAAFNTGRAREVYPRLGLLAAVPSALNAASCLLPKLPL